MGRWVVCMGNLKVENNMFPPLVPQKVYFVNPLEQSYRRFGGSLLPATYNRNLEDPGSYIYVDGFFGKRGSLYGHKRIMARRLIQSCIEYFPGWHDWRTNSKNLTVMHLVLGRGDVFLDFSDMDNLERLYLNGQNVREKIKVVYPDASTRLSELIIINYDDEIDLPAGDLEIVGCNILSLHCAPHQNRYDAYYCSRKNYLLHNKTHRRINENILVLKMRNIQKIIIGPEITAGAERKKWKTKFQNRLGEFEIKVWPQPMIVD